VVKEFTDYRQINRRLLNNSPQQRSYFERTISPRLGVSTKQILRELPSEGFATLLSSYNPPFLELEPRGLCRKSPFGKLRRVDRILPGYLGIGGYNIPLRCLLFTIALGKYQERIRKLTGETPRIFLFDASSYDAINSLDPQFSGNIIDRILDLSDSDSLDYRNRMFQRMAEISGLKTEVIPTQDLIDTIEYRDSLDEILKQRERMQSSWKQLVPPRFRSNPISLLYPAMEVAEAKALSKLYGIGIKFGPKGEKGFDALISGTVPLMLFCYTPSSKTKNGPRPPYRNREDITLDMNTKTAKLFLENQPDYVIDQFSDILRELECPSNDVIKETLKIFKEIKGE